MSNRSKNNSNRSGSHKAVFKARRENEKLIKQEFVVSGVDVIARDTNPILPHNQEEIAHDASKLFAAHATNEAFVRLNHNIKYRFDKLPFPVLGVIFGNEHKSGQVEVDTETEKARMTNDLSSAVASYGGSLAVVDIATTIGSNRVTERDAVKISKILRNPETSMAVVLYPPEIPIRLRERATEIENVLATESNTPILGLVLPSAHAELGAGSQLESGTVSAQLDSPANPDTYR